MSDATRDTGHVVDERATATTIEAWAPQRSACLEELVRGVAETLPQPRAREDTREVQLEVGAARDDDLVLTLLDEVCYLYDADRLVVVDVMLEERDDGNFDGAFVVASAPEPEESRAAVTSLSDARLERTDARWLSRVLVRRRTGPELP